MIPTLIVMTGADVEAPFAAALVRDGAPTAARTFASAAALGEAAAAFPEAERVVAVLPGEDVAARTLPWTSGAANSARARAAAASLFEDELAEGMDALHVATAPSVGGLVAAAVRRSVVEGWLAAFSAAGLRLDALAVDFLALPAPAEGALLVAREGRLVAAFGGRGFAVEADLLPAEKLLAMIGSTERFAAVADAAEWRRFPLRNESDLVGGADEATLASLYAKGVEAGALNLLQGPFRPRVSWTRIVGPWRRAAALAGAAAALGLLAIAADGARDLRAAERWKTAAATLHARAFPGVPARDALANARARLSGAGGRSFGEVTTTVARAAEAENGVEITRVRFDGAGGAYFVSVKSVADTEIEAFKSRLAAAGLSTSDSGGWRRAGTAWTGEIEVRTR